LPQHKGYLRKYCIDACLTVVVERVHNIFWQQARARKSIKKTIGLELNVNKELSYYNLRLKIKLKKESYIGLIQENSMKF